MSPHGWAAVLLGILGAAMLLLGLGSAGVLSTIPNSGPAHLPIVNFTATQGPPGTVTVQDRSSPGGASVASARVSWGDGANSSISAPGGSVTHTYATNGLTTITETVGFRLSTSITAPSVPFTSSATQLLCLGSSASLCGSTGGEVTHSVTAAYAWSSTGLSVTLTDTSTYQNSTPAQIVVLWGDGASAIVCGGTGNGCTTAPAEKASHLYASGGTYVVLWNVTGSYLTPNHVAPPPIYSQSSSAITVASGGNGTGSSSAQASSVSFSGFAGLETGFGVGLVGAAIAVAARRPGIAIVIGILGVAAGAGLAVGFL